MATEAVPVQEPGAGPGRRAWLVVLGGSTLLGLVSLVFPFGRDHGIYAWIARLVLDGRVMYRDIMMGMAPLTALVHALAMVLFGDSMLSIRLVDLAWTAATAALVCRFAWQAFGRRWLAVGAGIGFATLYYLFDFWNTAQVDGFLNLPIVGAFVLALPALQRPGAGNRWRWFGAGVLLGTAVFFKYPIGLLVPVLGGLALLTSLRSGRGRTGALWLLAGFGALAAVVLGALAVAGALPAFLEPLTRRAFGYATHDYLGEGALGRLVRMFTTWLSRPGQGIGGLLGVVGLLVSVVAFRQRRFLGQGCSRLALVLLWLWLAVALVTVYLQGRMFYYHYLPVLPPLALLTALGAAALLRPIWSGPEPAGRRAVLTAGVVLLLLCCTAFPGRFGDLAGIVIGSRSLADYRADPMHSTPDFSLGEQVELARHLRATTGPRDRVFVWGVDPLVNLLARRGSVTRFIYNHHLVSDWTWPGLRRRFINELASDPPEVFVIVHDDATPWVTGHDRDSYESLFYFDELLEFVARNYEVGNRVGRFDVLRRTDSEDRLPVVHASPERLRRDLRQVLQLVARFDQDSFRSVFWPWSLDSLDRDIVGPELAERFVSYRAMSFQVWFGERSIANYLPALSIWIRDDDRPFGSTMPFTFQNDGDPFAVADFVFKPLYTTADGAVLLYLADRETPGDLEPEAIDGF